MYSWEIKDLLQLKEYILEYQEYLDIIRTSPQINYLEYLKNEDKIRFTTDDKYEFKFKVYRKTKD